MNIADIIAIVIIVTTILIGAKRGLVKSVFSLGSLVLSLILAILLYPTVTNMLEGSFVDDAIRKSAYTVFDAHVSENTSSQSIDNLNLPEGLKPILGDAVSATAAAAKETLAEAVSTLLLKILGIIIVFLLSKILLWIITKVFNIITKLPIIHSLNKLSGGIFGALYGVLILYIVLAVLAFSSTTKVFSKPVQLVKDSAFVSVMYNQNILLNFIK
ncbi:MAG: CvpA family protein [Ruminococcaceae bacterium]|nr:CvpA family protein [Oscillospiraceae bacterium]